MLNGLQAQFNNASSAIRDRYKTQDHNNDISILMGNGAISNRLTLLSHQAEVKSEKEKQAFEDFLFQLTYLQILNSIAETRARTAESICQMTEILLAVEAEIKQIQECLKEISRRHHELNDAIEAGAFGKDKKGNYACQAINDSLQAYEKRTGQKVPDDLSQEMLIMLLQHQQLHESDVLVPELEKGLIRFNEFHDQVQKQTVSLETQLKNIDERLEAIESNDQLSEDAKKRMTIRVLEKASQSALDAEMVVHSANKELTSLVDEVRGKRTDRNDTLYRKGSVQEDAALFEGAEKQLGAIKPIIPGVP